MRAASSCWPLRLLLLVPLLLLVACASHFNPSVSPRPLGYETAAGAQEARILETADQDQLLLFGQWWLPDNREAPHAVVLLLHGTLVHSGFYDPLAREYVRHGYAVFGIDLRGWGQSQGYGRRGTIGSYDEYLEDLKVAHAEVRGRYPDAPLFIQGESMGGAIALLSQVRQVVEVDGLILNAPAVRPGLYLGPLRTPHWLADAGLWGLSLPGKAAPNMPVPVYYPWVERSAVSLMLKEKENQQRFLRDPHVTHTALPWSYFTGLRFALKEIKAGLADINVPVLIQQGTRDVLIPVSSSKYALANIASPDKQLKIYPDLTHGTLHDRRKEEVWADALDWLAERVTGDPVLTTRRQ
jgi:alpha-beta hydrolase superfamily lysophospholipase